MKKLIKDWKFYDVDGDLKLYVVSEDERGVETGKMFDIPESQIDPSDLNLVPDGGTTGQALKKYDDTDGGYAWQDTREVPTSGTQGQVITKGQDNNYGWEDLPTDDYSTSEVKTNKKYNNKDVYRKVVTISIPSESTQPSSPTRLSEDLTSLNIDDFLSLDGNVFWADSFVLPLPVIGYESATTSYRVQARCYYNTTDKNLYFERAIEDYNVNAVLTAVIEYTKVTV